MKERVKQLIRYEEWKRLFEKYERVLIPGTLVFGVIVDVITFRSIKIETTFLILGVYVLVAGTSIVLLNMRSFAIAQDDKQSVQDHRHDIQNDKQPGRVMSYAQLIAPLTLQFSFGALLSASLIFYWFSGAFSVSWPIILIIAILMTSNEVLRHYYLRPMIQVSVLSFILFSLFALVLPFVFNSIDPTLFVYAGLGSLFVTTIFLGFLLRFFVHIRAVRSHIAVSVLGIFAVMNLLYFLNVIPPIPLSLREAGVYHDIQMTGGIYKLMGESESFFDKMLPGQIVHLQKGKRVYVYSAIFAPTKLNTTIFHRWQYFDEEKHSWIDKDRLSFSITGGRNEGYRGYSLKNTLAEGKWRVNVETKRGQVLGRVPFEIIFSEASANLVPEVR